jgi:SAM-dependent methyltransferase
MRDHSGTLTQQGRDQQLRRFEALRALGCFDGRSILDIGCGNGELYRYLRACGEKPLYTGLEASPELASEGRARFHDDESCRFETGDASHFQPSTPYDFVIASAPLECEAAAGGPFLLDSLTRLFSWCTLGAAASFVSARGAARPRACAPRVDPAAAVKAALRLTPAVRLAHDYLPGDFTLYLYRTPPWGAGAAVTGAIKGAS